MMHFHVCGYLCHSWHVMETFSVLLTLFEGNQRVIRQCPLPWWRHQMETFSALLALCAGNSPVPVNSPHKGWWRGALFFFYLRPNKRLREQPWCWRFETLSWSLWRHCNASKVQWCPALMFSLQLPRTICQHYNDTIVDVMTSQIASLTIIYSTVYSGSDQRKHQSSASLVFVRGFHRWPLNSPQKWPVTRKMFPFDDVNMK